MRVAIIGNMNNNANNLIRYLRAAGIDAELLFYCHEADHFVPAADNIEEADYPSRVLSWGGYKRLYFIPASKIAEDLAEFDFLIGSRLAPAYVRKGRRQLDLFMPSGGDLHMLPMFSGFVPKDLFKFIFFSRWQKLGIRQSRCLYWDATNNELERKIQPVVSGLRRISHAIPAIYYPDYQGRNLEKRLEVSKWRDRFEAARGDADYLLFHHVKHVWLPKTITHYGKFHEKGNDQIIKGLRLFYDQNPEKKIRIIMFEFGVDHAETRKLAQDLDVDQHIAWFPQMERKELMIGIHFSDAVIGEITRSWFSYGTIFEAMVMSKPVIHHRNDKYYAKKKLYPMIDVRDDISISNAFKRISEDKIDLKKLGQEANKWLTEYGVGEPISQIIDMIHSKAKAIHA